MLSARLGQRTITLESKPYIIAEIGVNHEGSLEIARRLIRDAHEGGADAAKFQTYKAEKLAVKASPAYWDLEEEPTRSQYELFRKYDAFTEDDYRGLASYCQEVGIDFVSTPFDIEAVAFLEPLVPFFKIASADINNLPLLHCVGATGKPVVVSTGAATLAEVDQAVTTLERSGSGEIIPLHCILNYPTGNSDAHLGMIKGLQRAYPQRLVGYSDHTVPDEDMLALTTAYLIGARVIEKHFTYDRTLPGNDHYHAMDSEDLKRFVAQLDRICTLHGPSSYKEPIPSEALSRRNARRSIVTSQSISSGTVLSAGMLVCKRPATGIGPDDWETVLGRVARYDLPRDHILQWEDLLPLKDRSRLA